MILKHVVVLMPANTPCPSSPQDSVVFAVFREAVTYTYQRLQAVQSAAD